MGYPFGGVGAIIGLFLLVGIMIGVLWLLYLGPFVAYEAWERYRDEKKREKILSTDPLMREYWEKEQANYHGPGIPSDVYIEYEKRGKKFEWKQ